MSRSANSILAGDVSVTPIKLKYSASYNSNYSSSSGISNLVGVNGPVTSTGSVPQTTLNYLSARHLYYSNYLTGSFPVSASGYDNFLQSTAAYGTLDADQRYFPTESNTTIQILSIPRNVFGEKIGRQSLTIIDSNNKSYEDDGNGNISAVTYGVGYFDQTAYYDQTGYYDDTNIDMPKVGNVLYAQGIVVVTNQSYQSIFS